MVPTARHQAELHVAEMAHGERGVLPWRRNGKRRRVSCHGALKERLDGLPLVAIVGMPNVGKSLLFSRLTGTYVTVSNYPGTTVEFTQGRMRMECCDQQVGVIDTPGMFSLFPISEEERVARRILLEETLSALIHVVDAKNLERMLPLTLQMIEAGLPVILDLNLMDEAERMGIGLQMPLLSNRLGIPVLGTDCTTGRGVLALKAKVQEYVHGHASL